MVVAMVGMLLSVTVPISYSMYERYQASLEAERILTIMSNVRLEAFLYGEEKVVSSSEGRLVINNEVVDTVKGVFAQIDSPIRFFKTGTTSGGTIKVHSRNNLFIIDVGPPLGDLTLRTG
jgi:hypothetical protein